MDVETAAQPSFLRTVFIGRNPRITLVRIIILVIASFVVFRFVFLPIRVEGASMLPTYHERGVNFVNRLAYLFHEPRRGDVVAIRTSGISIMYMKRIVGLPGETVAFHNGHAVIDGRMLEEPYLRFESFWEHEPRRLGPDEYYCVGDNRSMPQADHTEGKAARDRIVGKVLL
jgi:signal peptidase I